MKVTTMSAPFEVITYEDTATFAYTLPDQEEPDQISRELTLVWDESLEAFFETYSPEKPYQIHSFKTQRDKDRFIQSVEDKTDEIIDAVEEEVSQHTKFGYNYTSPTYED